LEDWQCWKNPVFNSAQDYFLAIETRLIASPVVTSFSVLRQETLGNAGFFRLRAVLADSSQLTLFEYFTVSAGKASVEKFSFHWQESDGTLIRRWDNAPHHRQLATAPNHVHEGSEANVLAHAPVDAMFVLLEIERRIQIGS
jgi:hypothetical protein